MLRRRRDDGFTLVELLVSISVLGVIMIGLGAVMFGSMASNVQSKIRLDETRDQQFAAVYFGTDAQAATTILTGVAATCGTGTAAVEFRGASYHPTDLTATSTIVSYVFSTATAGGKPTGVLRRQSCETGVAQTSTTVADNLSATAAPTTTCQPSACTATSKSTSVTIDLVRRSGDTPFTLVGTRRTS